MRRIRLTPATCSSRLMVRLAPASVGLFRFLLEARDNLAGFTVLDRREALLKIFFSPHQEEQVRSALDAINTEVPLAVFPWPYEERIQALHQPSRESGQPGPEQAGTADMMEQSAQAD